MIGVHEDMSNTDYHALEEWVSSSQLKRFLPEFFKPFTSSARDALDFGTAVHTTVLGVGEPLVEVPFQTWAGKEAKEQRETAYAAQSVPILSKDLGRIQAMADAVGAHFEAHRYLYELPGAPEVSVFAEVDGVPSKCRFDRLLEGVAVDLKTTSAKPGAESLARAVIDYGYDLQAAHYLAVAETAGITVDRFVFVFVGKESPHHVSVVELDEQFLERGRVLRDLALQRLLHPQVVDPYPGATGVVELTPPRWAVL